MATVITTGVTAHSTSVSPAVCSGPDGRIWTISESSGTFTWYYSDDGGDTWSTATGTVTGRRSGVMNAFCVDIDGNLHFAAGNSGNSATHYYYGTVSGGTITWSSPLEIYSGSFWTASAIIAFYDGSTLKAFVGSTASSTHAIKEVTISGGTPSLAATSATAGTIQWIDLSFVHTGDGLTADASPHIGVHSSNSTTIYFEKLAYSSGSWSMGARRTLSSGTYSRARGTFVNYPGATKYFVTIADQSTGFALWVRDVADTSTSASSQLNETVSGACDFTASSSGVMYLCWNDSNGDPAWTTYQLGGVGWGSITRITGETTSVVKLNRGNPTSGIGLVWLDTAPAPDELTWETVALFTSPPTWVSPQDGVSERRELELVLDWTFNDPDSGASQTAYTLKRVVDAVTTTYWNGDGWQASEDASTKIASTTSAHTLSKSWAAPDETQHVYSVKTWDNHNAASVFSNGLTIYPSSIASSNRGLAFPKPWKRQDDILATLKANNDYLLAFNNNYVPTYGDANNDLTLRAGIRTASDSLVRNMFPPVIGSYSLGNGTSYFQDLGATNVYRTNEIALSSRRFKRFRKHSLPDAVSFVNKIPVTTWEYLDKRRMGDAKERFGFTAEDFLQPILELGITPKDSAILFNQGKDEGGEIIWYLNHEQLVPILWQAVQELSAEVFKLKNPGQGNQK